MPDPESFDPADYTGVPREDAKQLAESRGWLVRELTPDMVVTAEFRDGRLNLVVDPDSIVIDARLG